MYFQGLHGERGLPGLIGRIGPKVRINIKLIIITIWTKLANLCEVQIRKYSVKMDHHTRSLERLSGKLEGLTLILLTWIFIL